MPAPGASSSPKQRSGFGAVSALPARQAKAGESQHDDEAERTAPLVSGYFNLLKSTVGSGTLGLPFAFAQTGWLLGLLLTAFAGGANAYGLFLLSACANKIGGTRTSWNGLALRTYPWTAPLVDVLLIINCAGSAIGHLIIIGPVLASVSVSTFAAAPGSLAANAVFWKAVVFWGFVAPLGSLPKLSWLQYSSALGFAFGLYVMAATLAFALSPGLDACPGNSEPNCGGDFLAFGSDAAAVISTIPVFTFAFLSSENLFIVYNEVKNPTLNRMRDFITNPMCATGVVVFSLTAFATYANYGSSVQDNFILSYPIENPIVVVANIAVVILVIAGSPIKIHPTREAVSTLVHLCINYANPDATPRTWFGGRWPLILYVVSTFFILLGIFITGISVTNLGLVFSINGALAGTGLSYWIPGLMFCKLFEEDFEAMQGDAEKGDEPSKRATTMFSLEWLSFHRAAAFCLAAVGLLEMTISLTSIVYQGLFTDPVVLIG